MTAGMIVCKVNDLFRFRFGTHGLNEELGRHNTRTNSKASASLQSIALSSSTVLLWFHNPGNPIHQVAEILSYMPIPHYISLSCSTVSSMF